MPGGAGRPYLLVCSCNGTAADWTKLPIISTDTNINICGYAFHFFLIGNKWKFWNASVMWSVDSSGKEFLQSLNRAQNMEGRSERPENVFVNQDMALSNIWMTKQVFWIQYMCHLNDFFLFPSELVGWLQLLAMGLQSAVYITWPTLCLSYDVCGKTKQNQTKQNQTKRNKTQNQLTPSPSTPWK